MAAFKNASIDLPEGAIHPATRAAWRAWLAAHHASAVSVWVTTWRKAAGKSTLSYDDMVEEALCFGWVDSRPRQLDEQRTMLYFTPRKKASGWSKPNKERIARLQAAGLIEPAGQAVIDAAQRDGSWEKLDAVEALETPSDLEAALATLPPAADNWAAFPRSAKRGILEWIVQAKRAETRAARITQTATMAQRNERANQWSPKT
jgi:uncharacterized protein YdeI (YjbR/CyaY-like superfamily)